MTNTESTVPGWVADAVFYQIFPERFANGDPSNDPSGVEPWGGKPASGNYFGGDLQGIIGHLDHCTELGINAIYLNPIFAANSNHKYNTYDYSIIDPAFGTAELFGKLMEACRSRGIRVILDGVFNHVGVAHFAFRDVVEHGPDSKYAGWFNIFSYPVQPPKRPNYECWWGFGGLPKLMVQNPEVKQYLFDVTRQWTPLIDGWRLDVPNELPHSFWKEWRRLVRSINPECYIVGEIWDDASAWLQGDEFDSVMNYRFRSACVDLFAKGAITPSQFDAQLAAVRASYNAEHTSAMLNLIGSHDTERFLTLAKEEAWRLKLAAIFQMTYPGAPMVYYGDEIGLTGGKDPDCRKCMVWEKGKWDRDLFETYKKIIGLRRRHDVLRHGTFETVLADDRHHLVAFTRSLSQHRACVALNAGARKAPCAFPVPPEMTEAIDELSGKKFTAANGTLQVDVPARSAMVFIW